MTEKPSAIILPIWNPDEPRFIVETCEHRIAEDREFRNNTCVYNQRLGFAYNVNEIVEVLNSMGDKLDKLEKENEQLRQTMQKVCELLEEEVDLFSDEATEHDVIAYCEMQDFDNKDAYYICTATKKAIQMLKGGDSV